MFNTHIWKRTQKINFANFYRSDLPITSLNFWDFFDLKVRYQKIEFDLDKSFLIQRAIFCRVHPDQTASAYL